ncbi:MAG: phosphoribosyltransferase [Flavobacteriales bacterium]|nr:phosphoribosyltransferase [Flavobacteriales bacterium]
MPSTKTLILNNEEISQKIDRMAYQILEDNYLEKEIVVVGMANNGYLFAEKIVKKLKKISSDLKITLIKLTIDKDNQLNNNAFIDKPTDILNDKVIILVDDVLNSGKTLIYGVKYLLDFPVKRMSTAVLVDRNHKRYPIGTHYTGLALSTTLKNHISVEFETKGEMKAYLS